MPTPITYDPIIKRQNGQRRIAGKEQNGRKVSFSKPVTDKGGKVYVLQDDLGNIIYVGHTIRSIGQITTRRHTPYNYKWSGGNHGHKKLRLSVFMLDVPGDCKDIQLYGEAVEAELVYLVREQTGHWPVGQNEIHFNNDFPVAARNEASKMYALL